MTVAPAITLYARVDEALRDHGAVRAVSLGRNMHCPGCHMVPCMIRAEAAANNRLATDDLMAELRAAGETL